VAPASTTVALGAALFTLALALVALIAGTLLALRLARSRREVAEELRGTRAREQAVAQLLDVWVWHSDAAHRLVLLRPPQGAPTSDWSAAALPAPIWARFEADDADALRARLANAAPLDDIKVRLPAAGGAVRQGLLRGRAVTDALGRFAGYHGTLRDLAQAQASLAGAASNTPAAASAANAVPAVAATSTTDEHDSFSYTVSHDLRAPIRVVEGFTKIVKEDYGRLLDRVGNDHLDRVLGAAARMNNMIDALLALSKLSSQPLARQPVNLSQLAGFVADDLRRQWPDRTVQVEVEPGMQVQGDPTLLRVVIENLLGNAWKYTGKTASANISFGRHPTDAEAFSVCDNGAGFDMRFADRLFGVFQRLHSANDFPGTGVGLASVRRIVRRHGGEIWGEADVGRGARFHFSLPQNSLPQGGESRGAD
jgi:signal transduction histidine kinase